MTSVRWSLGVLSVLLQPAIIFFQGAYHSSKSEELFLQSTFSPLISMDCGQCPLTMRVLAKAHSGVCIIFIHLKQK